MLVLIAESKTMQMREVEVSHECYEAHKPVGEDVASEIMDGVRDMSVGELASVVKISQVMASRLKEMAYEFPNKTTGLMAIEAFTGVVFKNLDYPSLSEKGRELVASNVRIISSLYGWLRPDDIVKPYRLEYSAPVAPDHRSLSTYWKQDVTIRLVKELQDRNEKEILDLLPADAAKCVDWKLVKHYAKVLKVDFKEQSGEAVKSPHAGKLKALRGKLLREILTEPLATISELKSFENDEFIPIDADYPDRIGFLG